MALNYAALYAKYGPEYAVLMQRAYADSIDDSKPDLTLTMPSLAETQAMKNKIYMYMKCLRAHGERKDLIHLANQLTVRVVKRVITFSVAANTWDCKFLRKTLDLPDDFNTMTHDGAVEYAALAKLYNMRNNKLLDNT